MSDFTMTIDGRGVAGEQSFAVLNPSTGAIFAHAPECSRVQLDEAMYAAERAFLSWRKDEAFRRTALRACAAAIEAHQQELGEILCREQGKPLQNALGEVNSIAQDIKAYADVEIPCDILQDDDQKRVEVRRQPLGVVAAITPWNFPVLVAGWKFAPILLTGNTCVLKPSPFTPLSTLKLGEILRDVLPAGVLNVVSGGDELGAWMTEHPTVRKISFTGSVATGKKVAKSAASDLKRVTLELGGNDPAIILPDVDLQTAAQKLFWSAFFNSGQVCIAIKRLYVHEDIYNPMVEAIADIARSVKVGDGFDAVSQLGPVNNRPQFERVINLVDDAKKAGARMVTGGNPQAGNGYFFEPTVVSDISDGVRLVDEEQFGPVLPIIPFRDIDDVLERANSSHFGLGGSVWTKDFDRGMQIGSRLECGTVWINHHMSVNLNTPYGGAKWSGIGYEFGKPGLELFTQLQVMSLLKQ